MKSFIKNKNSLVEYLLDYYNIQSLHLFLLQFLFFALVAAAFASPKPDPQVLTYSAPGVFPAVGYSPYSAYAPVAYSAPAYAPVPYAYTAGAYYVKWGPNRHNTHCLNTHDNDMPNVLI